MQAGMKKPGAKSRAASNQRHLKPLQMSTHMSLAAVIICRSSVKTVGKQLRLKAESHRMHTQLQGLVHLLPPAMVQLIMIGSLAIT